jgi:hypothetical protein
MSTSEYLAFIPLLIYGLGLTNLLGEWKRIIDRNQIFLPYSLMTLFLTEISVYNIFIYQRVIGTLEGLSYLKYLALLITPLLFYLATLVFTPDPGANTKEHFIKRMPLFYFLVALWTAGNFISGLEDSLVMNISRIVFIVIVSLAGYTKKIWLVYVLIFIWLISLLIRGSVISISM